MVIRTNFGNIETYLHTAWSDEPDGSDMQTEEFDSVYIGTFTDSNSSEDLDNSKYSWCESDPDSEDEESIDTELSDSINELSSSSIVSNSNLDATQYSSDSKIGNANELKGTNKGSTGWSDGSGYSGTSISDVIYSQYGENTNYVRFYVDYVSTSHVYFAAADLIEKVSGLTDTYTLSFDIRMTGGVFDITTISLGDNLITFDAYIPSAYGETIDIVGTWTHYTSTATATGAENATLKTLNFIYDISSTAMEYFEIANLKIEAGATETAWTQSAAEILGVNGRYLKLYNDLIATDDSSTQTLLIESWTQNKSDTTIWARNRIFTTSNTASASEGTVGSLFLETSQWSTTTVTGGTTINHDGLTLYRESISQIEVAPDSINIATNAVVLSDTSLEIYGGVTFGGAAGSVSGLIKGMSSQKFTDNTGTISAGNKYNASANTGTFQPFAIMSVSTTSTNAFMISAFGIGSGTVTATVRNVNASASSSATVTWWVKCSN